MTEVEYPAPGDASPDNPETIRRVNDENRTDVREPITEPVEQGPSGGNTAPTAPTAPTPTPTTGNNTPP